MSRGMSGGMSRRIKCRATIGIAFGTDLTPALAVAVSFEWNVALKQESAAAMLDAVSAAL